MLDTVLRTLRTKTGRFLTIGIFILGCAFVIPALMYRMYQAAIILSAVWLIAWLLFIVLMAERFTLVQIHRRSNEINTRVRVMARVNNDIAGSVGRAAPIIREIKKKVDTGVVVQGFGTSVQLAQPSSQASSIPEGVIPRVEGQNVAPRRDLTVMVIADTFTINAFAPEWNQVLPTPENWLEMLDETKPELLFIESAWDGNGGAWRYHLVGDTAPRPAVKELIAECKRREIPVVLWNKEDPPHYEDFLPMARLVDYVFTTESDKIPDYCAELGHERVSLLPFAAQPAMHNPAAPGGCARDRDVVFGGMYFREKYPERREQMAFLLPAAANFGLDIFSRSQGGDEKYQFPEQFTDFVRPALPYKQMVGAYHQYKVVINVNSVPDSSTMCARRIFEATACGAAVLSAATPANETYFPGNLISQASNQDEAYYHIRSLIRSKEYRDRLVHRAQRQIWDNHTYSHRVATILSTVGLTDEREQETATVFIASNRPHTVPLIIENVLRQKRRPDEVCLLAHGFEFAETDFAQLVEEGISVKLLSAPAEQTLGGNLNALVDEATSEILLRMDDDDWYGPNYVHDMMHAIDFSGATMVGKAASYMYFEGMDATVLTLPTMESQYTDLVRGATFAARAETFRKYRFPELGLSEDSSVLAAIRRDGGRIYAADRFNFVVNRWADKGRHTWQASDMQLFSTGEMSFKGNDYSQVAV